MDKAARLQRLPWNGAGLIDVLRSPLPWISVLMALVVLLAAQAGAREVSLQGLWLALWSPGETVNTQWLHHAWWPRLSMSLLCGAALGIAGVMMQQVLRNPLASPTTLGVANGASVAMALALVYVPSLIELGREWVALAGGGISMSVVFMLAWRRRLAPMVVVLAGMVMNLYLAAVSTILLLLHQETLAGLLVWGAGSLTQTGWDGVSFLIPRLVAALAIVTLLVRPLSLLSLNDESAHSLGISLRYLRLAGLGVSVFLTAVVVSSVGIIGFVGLAAPALVRILGARTLGTRLIWAAPMGACLLALTDLAIQCLPNLSPTLIPAGAMTAALGAPLLLWLIPRLRLGGSDPEPSALTGYRVGDIRRRLGWLLAALAVFALMALGINQGMDGWRWLLLDDSAGVLTWVLPRTLAAGAAGGLLALAGTILQRTTGNPMASPEVLGISSGTALGFVAAIYGVGGSGPLAMIAMGTLGALLTLGLIVLVNWRSGFAPERVILTGIAMAALFEAMKSFLLAGGDPRGREVLAWISGSTYFVEMPLASIALLVALASVVLLMPLARWLDLLSLGAPVAGSLGLSRAGSRLVLLGVASVMTAVATLVIGPLSFVGLLAPHLARLLGLARAREQLLGSALCGAALMVVADWLGRQWLFPEELPAGIVASLVGGLYFMWGLRRF